MPAELMNDKQRKTRRKDSVLVWILLMLFFTTSLAAIWLTFGHSLGFAAAVKTQTVAAPVMESTIAESTVVAPTHTLSPSKTATRVVPTQTSTPQPQHLIETAVGVEHLFVVHQVMEGESMISLAEAFGTSPEAIRAVNYAFGDVLWANTVLVIPLNQTDVSGVLPMSTYAIPSDGVTVEALAAEQNVDPTLLRGLNALPEGYVFHQGEWALIPHETPIP